MNVVGLPTVLSLDDSVTTYVGDNDVNANSMYVDIGPTYVYVYAMTMSNDGLIYVIIGEDSLWSRAPTISEIKKGSGPDGLPPVYYRVLAYRTAEQDTGYVAYTGVGDSTLKMYIMASDDNPFDTAKFSTIREYTITKELPKWESHLVLIGVLLCLLVLI